MNDDYAGEAFPRTIPRNTSFPRGVTEFVLPDRFDGASWRDDSFRSRDRPRDRFRNRFRNRALGGAGHPKSWAP